MILQQTTKISLQTDEFIYTRPVSLAVFQLIAWIVLSNKIQVAIIAAAMIVSSAILSINLAYQFYEQSLISSISFLFAQSRGVLI